MTESTWPTREGPILEAMCLAMDSEEDIRSAGRRAVPDLPDRVYHETLLTLAEDDYIEAHVQRLADGSVTVMPTRLMAKGRRAVGQWPGDDLVAELTKVVERLEAAEENAEVAGRFRRFRDALSDAGKDVVARTLVEMLKSIAGRVS